MRRLLLAAAAAGLISGGANAAETQTPPAQPWSFNGIFGTIDRAAAQRGFQVYKEVCAACHAMHLVAYRDLGDLGFGEDEVKGIAAAYTVVDGPNDEGENFERPARPSDRFKSPFANEKQARFANNGAYPPDLSLMAKARMGGPDYIFALLTGYKDPPTGVTVMDGMHYNEWFPGHQIAMAKPLNDDQITFADGTKATVEQMARDVSTFLMWTAEPKLEARKRLGVKVVLFLLLLTGLLFFVKRRIWAKLH